MEQMVGGLSEASCSRLLVSRLYLQTLALSAEGVLICPFPKPSTLMACFNQGYSTLLALLRLPVSPLGLYRTGCLHKL